MTKKTAKDFKGEEIEEVWNFRLSHGSPILFNSGKTWVIKVFATDPFNEAWEGHPGLEVIETPDGPTQRVVLEEIATDIPTAGTTIEEGQRQCYPYLYEIRDKYSRSNIELRKPVVAMIEESRKRRAEVDAEVAQLAMSAKRALEEDGDEAKAAELLAAAKKKRAESLAMLSADSAKIKNAEAEMRRAMKEA